MLIIVKANISMNVANIQVSTHIDYEHDVSYYDLIDKVMLIIVKANINMNVENIQVSTHIDYEHDISYYKTRVAK
jgi:hypothetical protein